MPGTNMTARNLTGNTNPTRASATKDEVQDHTSGCLFPELTGRTSPATTTTPRRQTTQLESQVAVDLQDCAELYQAPKDLVLAGIWAVVPQRFTRGDQARVGLDDFKITLISTHNAVFIKYSTDFLSNTFARAVAGAITQALAYVRANPPTLISTISLLCPKQQDLVESWNQQKSTESVPFLFQHIARQVKHRPTAIALESHEGTWTYRELDRISTVLAAKLQARGVTCGSLVPVCFEKTGCATLAMLAVNRAGSAFVPSDPSHPGKRRDEMVKRVKPTLILTSEKQKSLFRFSDVDVLVVSSQTVDTNTDCRHLKYTPPRDSSSPAYILFTSGSTGIPKACEISHAAFSSIDNHVPALQLGPDIRALQFASFTFGMAIIGQFCTLAAGGTICMLSDYQRLDSLAAGMSALQVNWTILTPTVLGSLSPRDLPCLRHLIIAGEALNGEQLARWAASGEVKVYQAFGLTEWTGIFAVSGDLACSASKNNHLKRRGNPTPTICRPVDGRAWLLDPDNVDVLAPVGAPGELVISGPGLASGYFDDREVTERAFSSATAVPWLRGWPALPAGTRVYATGDIMRYDSNGALEVCGRKDHQVKIRGMRVELGEVESALQASLPEAKGAVAMALTPSGGDGQLLTAFVVPLLPLPVTESIDIKTQVRFLEMDTNCQAALATCRGLLKDRLPDYMVPRYLLPVAALPTTVSGKIDRQRLAQVAKQLTVDELQLLAGFKRLKHRDPTTDTGRLVCDMVSKVLAGVSAQSMANNFFELGGDSVSAMKLTGLARRHGFKLTVGDVFRRPMLADLAAGLVKTVQVTSQIQQPFALIDGLGAADIKAQVAQQCGLDASQVLDAYPCTPLQEGLCALSARDTTAYKARVVCECKPGTDASSIKTAWERIFESHDILRTRLAASSSQTIQAVVREAFDWDYAPTVKRYDATMNDEPMGIGKRLVRGCLISGSTLTLVLFIHHTLCDRWSIRLLEQMQILVGSSTAPTPRPFRPFIKHLLKARNEVTEYWTSQFAGLEATVFPELPEPGYTPQVDQRSTYTLQLPSHVARSQGTMATHIRLEWALVLSHYTRLNDVLFGATVTGRGAHLAGVETLSGPTIATVPVRIKLDTSQTAATALGQVQQQLIDLIPYEQAGLQNIRHCEEGAATTGGFASYALCLECYLAEDEQTLDLVALFDETVISKDRVRRLLMHLDLTSLLSLLSHVSPHDWTQIRQWNAVVPPRTKETVHGLISQRAQSSADKLAVSASDASITYRELEHYATILADELLRCGATPGSITPVYFEKGCWAIVAMLAVLKAGCGIVHLDPLYPRDRIRKIHAQTGSPVILCSACFAPRVEELGAKAIIVNQGSGLWRRSIPTSPFPLVAASAILYLIFTSGSTGEPKGLMVDHAAFIASARGYIPEIQINGATRMLQFASVAFDAYYVEIFPVLMVGGAICVPSATERRDDISAFVRQEKTTHALFTPSYARTLDPSTVPSLLVLWIIGEAVLDTDVALWGPHVRLVNGYGPAECAACATTQHYDMPAVSRGQIHPHDIGHPRGCMAWVCDPDDVTILLPIGVVGELIIEGPTVGAGYYKDLAKTGEVFIKAPQWLQEFRGNTSSRVYKTGDLVRFHEDGRLRFVGRRGEQFKLRGQRIEPWHVEHQLLQTFETAIQVAVVFGVPKGAEDRPALVAFVLTEETRVVSDKTANTTMPEYMIPTLLLAVSFMPRTLSGKLDRRRLKQEIPSRTFPELAQYESSVNTAVATIQLPGTDAERELQATWSRVLRVPAESIGVNQSFYHFGGDSIIAMLVVAQARNGPLKLVVTVDDILRLRTIHAIAAQALKNSVKDTLQLVTSLCPGYPISALTYPAPLLRYQPGGPEPVQPFSASPSGPSYRAMPAQGRHGETTYRSHDIADKFLLDTVMARSLKSLDITRGPLFSTDLITAGTTQEQWVFIVAHHLVVDLVSWTVLLRDPESLLRREAVLAPSVSFQQWASLLAKHGKEQLSPLQSAKQITNSAFDLDLEFFWGVSSGINGSYSSTLGLTREMVLTIPPSTTGSLLGHANQAFGTQPVELLHAALVSSFHETFPDRAPPTVFLEGHGREPWDTAIGLARTVGWFTTLVPVPIQLPNNRAGDESALYSFVRLCKDGRRSLRHNGLEDFTARYYNKGTCTQGSRTPMEVVLNYAGRYEGQLAHTATSGLFEVCSLQDHNIYAASDQLKRWSLVDINALVEMDDSLTLSFTVPKGCSSAILESWISNLRKTLDYMAAEFSALEHRLTLADCPLLDLNYEQLGLLHDSLDMAGIETRNIEGVYPCAPIQRGILLSQAKNPALYHVAVSWHVNTKASAHESVVEAIKKAKGAVQQVVARHAALRSVLIPALSGGGAYEQVVQSVSENEIPVIYLDGELPSPGTDFRPTPECPSRFALYVSREQVYIRLDITHALSDAQTLQNVQSELRLAYAGELSTVKAPAYANYLSFLRVQDEHAAGKFWDEYLTDCEPCVFPTLNEHSPDQPDENHTQTLVLTESQVAAINSFCQARNLTAATIFSSAWSLVLRAYTGFDNICFGYANSGRELPIEGAAEIVGPLINVLTTSLKLANLTVGELLQTVSEAYLAGRAHQTFPFAEILHRKGLSATSLFDTRHDPAEYAITVNIDIEETKTVVHLRHWLSRVSDEQAALIASSFQHAVTPIISNETVPATAISLVSATHYNLLQGWIQRVPATPSYCIHQAIDQRARQLPNKTAICTSSGSLTYSELSSLSDALAWYLSRGGVGPGDFIPLCFEKGLYTIVAMLAILKTGAAFALLDATHPDQRLVSLVQEAGSSIVVASSAQAGRCTSWAQRVITVGADDDVWRASPPAVRPGKPKGVIVEHGGFGAMAEAAHDLWRITHATRFIHFASHAFDVGSFEMLFPLMSGATTCVLSEEERRDSLAESMTSFKASHALLTPTVSRTILPSEVPHLRVLGLVGEAVTQVDIELWAEPLSLLNIYGPAEATVEAVCQGNITTAPRAGDIGRPVGSVAWVIDPENPEQLLPIGALGELLIEGPIVARGYRPDATRAAFIDPPGWLRELRGDTKQYRLYRTGDMARYRPDGQMTVFGRKDTQIKIRGQRVELGEVEYQVHSSFEGSQDVVVDLVYTGKDKTPNLYAFICLDADTAKSSAIEESRPGFVAVPDNSFRAQAATCASHLLDHLPAYMVPSYFVPLNQMPLNASGKADQKQLRFFVTALTSPELQAYRPIASKHVALSTPEEHLLQTLWAEVLDLQREHIGAEDHFFQLGGDSVNGMRLAATARRHGLHISVSHIFANPRLGALARAGETQEGANQFEYTPFSLSPVPKEFFPTWEALMRSRGIVSLAARLVDVLPASAGQAFFLERPTLHHFTFQLDGRLDVERLRKTCEIVYAHYPILRTVFTKYQDQVLQLVLDNLPLPFHHIVTDDNTDPALFGEKLRLAGKQNQHGIFIDRPVFAFIIISNPAKRTAQLYFRMTHAQWDGVSLGELFATFRQAWHNQATAPSTPLSRVLYHRFTRDKASSFTFWKEYLAGSTITPLAGLATLPTRSELDLSKGETIWPNINLHPAPVPPAGITMASVVKAAWALVLASDSGSKEPKQDIVFGQTVNGRSSAPLADIDSILGCCLNFILVRIQVEGGGRGKDWTITDLLTHTQAQYQETVAHDDIGFPDLVSNCTDWPSDTTLSTIVQHQNIPLTHKMELEGLETAFAFNGFFRPGRELFIFTEPHSLPDGDLLSVQFCVNPNMMTIERASVLHKKLVDTIVRLCEPGKGGESVASFL
ncbi:hypothetical protein ASPVEDRAFT_76237 [Aspergillus versicolor CBS 583.65]|uniref:Carrier domain-containing protein n=1 Tax=Aspergillus versicolor CBS 583.65 TaxID=1036611 RepID=A0A1L9Q0L5_ASPVE|nr:uncharacterized protein ASPVEDRAFT_76237 [Aspergillus versicolor CBS 583.65]OJJ07311.1 hypothetical protein ASPVEDRAFT_76237 [Aspergillus versicolor CBS 583.65]